jgi:hypothetical protein
MKKKYSNLEWLVMDMKKLNFESETFDIVIDKAGMDAILADEGGDVWHPN